MHLSGKFVELIFGHIVQQFNKSKKAKKSNETPPVIYQNAAPGASPSHIMLANQPGFSLSHVALANQSGYPQAPAFQNQMNFQPTPNFQNQMIPGQNGGYGIYPGQIGGQQNIFPSQGLQQGFQPPKPNFQPQQPGVQPQQPGGQSS